jgi:hypothetical protein
MHLRRPSPAGIIASLALFLALGGSAMAANHYMITSTNQIKPSVLKALHGSAGAKGPTGAAGANGTAGQAGGQGSPGIQGPQGPSGAATNGIVARLRSVAPVVTKTTEEGNPTLADDPLSGTWTQHAGELDQLAGQVTITFPPETTCEGSGDPVAVELLLDGNLVGGATSHPGEAEVTETVPIGWSKHLPAGAGAPFAQWPEEAVSPWLYEPGSDTAHTLTAEVADDCAKSGHPTIQSVSVDVLGVS